MELNTRSPELPEDKWHAFVALDVTGHAISEKQQIAHLDLAAHKQGMGQIAQKLNQFVERRAKDPIGTSFPLWTRSIPPAFRAHSLTTASKSSKTCEEMKPAVDEVVTKIVNEVDYNGLHVVTAFLSWYKKEKQRDPKVTVADAFTSFEPDTTTEAASRGANCVGKAWEIVKRLESLGIEAHVIVTVEGENRIATHAAALVPCKDGLLLIEIEHDVPVKILKPDQPYIDVRLGAKPDDPTLRLSISTVEVPGNQNTKTPMIILEETIKIQTKTKTHTVQYMVRPCLNPDQSVMKRWLLHEHFYPLSTGMRHGKAQHAVQVNISETPGYPSGKITFNEGAKKFRLPLDAIDPNTKRVDRDRLVDDKGQELTDEKKAFFLGKEGVEVGGPFFDAFESKKSLLWEQIFTIAKNRDVLRELKKRL